MKLSVALMLAWTFMIFMIAYAWGYQHAVFNERALQTQILLDIQTFLVDGRCVHE